MVDKNFLAVQQEDLKNIIAKIDEFIVEDNFTSAVKLLSQIHPADISDYFEAQNHKDLTQILKEFSDLPSEVLTVGSSRLNDFLYEHLGVNKFAKLLSALDVEDAMHVLSDFDNEIQKEILRYVDINKKQHLTEGFSYPEGSVGRNMEKAFLIFSTTQKVSEVLEVLRKKKDDHNFYAVIIVDNKNRPLRYVMLSSLLCAEPDDILMNLANEDFHIANTYQPVKEIAYIFKQYGLNIVPVVNKSGKLVGTLSINNILYILEEQAEEEMLHLGGVVYQDTFYNVFETAKHRFPWLFCNLLIAFLTSVIISSFSTTISRFVTLAAITPMVASIGGNAATQVMTITIRALVNREITNSYLSLRIICKELMVCALNGLVLGVLSFLIIGQLYSDSRLALVFASAVVINLLVAGIFGSAIPIMCERWKIDPATASSVFLGAITDAFGFFCFLFLSYFFL